MYAIAAISLAFILLLLALSPQLTMATGDDEFARVLGPTAERDAAPSPLATLRLGGGSELSFYELVSDEDEFLGIGVQRLIRIGGVDPYSVPALRGANPLELMHAFSSGGFPIPHEFTEHFDNRFADEQRGWALGVATAWELGPVPDNMLMPLSCAALKDSFESQVTAAFAGEPYYSDFYLLNHGPTHDVSGDGAVFYGWNPAQGVPDAYEMRTIINDDRATTLSVQLCATDPGPHRVRAAAGMTFKAWDTQADHEAGEAPLFSGEFPPVPLVAEGDFASFHPWFVNPEEDYWYWDRYITNAHAGDRFHVAPGVIWPQVPACKQPGR